MIHRSIFAPSSIVVVGASDDPAKVGGKILKNIKESSFSGPLWGINPKADSAQGVPCPSLEDLPEAELAIIAVPARFIPDYMRTLARDKGTKGFIVLSAGFSEMGDHGKALQDELVAIAESCGGTMIGPNCTGVLTRNYAGIFAGPVPPLSPSGCDLVSGSGATAAFITEQGILAGLRFSQMISVGNSAHVGVEDILEHWDRTFDPEHSSRIKLLYLESINDPQRLLEHSISLRRKGCRICAVKAGSSQAGSRAASSHTGAMASNDSFVQALFNQAGIIRCRGREELVLAAAVCSYPRMDKPSMAVVTHAGGPGVMLTDSLSESGISVPRLEGPAMDALLGRLHHGSSVANPIDFLATGSAEHLDDIISTIKNSCKDIGGISVIFGSPGLTDITDVLTVLARHCRDSSIPVYPILPSLVTARKEMDLFLKEGLPFFSDEVSFASLLGRSVMDSFRELQKDSLNEKLEELKRGLTPNREGYLPPDQVASLLDAAGIARTGEQSVTDMEDLQFVSIPFPWAMKVTGPVHKSDVGGVRLNVKSLEDALSAAEKLLSIPGAKGMVIQEMAEGMEFFCGVSRDDSFGHLLMAGLGGIFVETLKDTVSVLLPIDQKTALDLLRGLRSYPILKGTRGKHPLAVESYADMLVRLGMLTSTIPDIAELDINPVLVNAAKAVCVDARIRMVPRR